MSISFLPAELNHDSLLLGILYEIFLCYVLYSFELLAAAQRSVPVLAGPLALS